MKKIKISVQGLLHGSIFFLVVELYGAWVHYRSGYYLYNSDGSLVTQWQRFINGAFYQGLFITLFLLAFLAEISYNRFFKTKKYPKYFITVVLSAFFLEIALHGWQFLTKEVPGEWSYGRIFFVALYIFVYSLVRDFISGQILKKNRQIWRKEAEIKVLKAQVNPHFFFNTLNTIYGTALMENASRTAKCIEQLSGIMRHTIAGAGNDYTPLSEEAAFLEDYLQLQKMRIPHRENIRIETAISIDNPSLKIAPLLLLPFIENAFKYGISTEHPCKVKIVLGVKEKILRFQTENTWFKDPPSGLGTGIENTRQRLDLIYPGRHRLTYGPAGHDYKVSLTLNLD